MSPRRHLDTTGGHYKHLNATRMLTSLDDFRSRRFWKAIVAELLGTLFLVFVGCGSCTGWGDGKEATIVQIALSFGIIVATMVWCIGHISGGHINPAVTAAMLITRKISLLRWFAYLIAQLTGAIAGAALLKAVTPKAVEGTLGSTLVNDKLDVGRAVGVEFLITFVLVFTVFASCDTHRSDTAGSKPLSIGLSVLACHLAAIRYTGASMNSARSFGPAVIMGTWENHWVYWVGPIAGGIVAGLLYDNLFAVNASLSKARAFLLTSDYDNDKYEAKKMKIKIIDEDGEECDASLDSPIVKTKTRV